uniref:Uncharacterized protein n=1 Tax=Aegilops tauschii subsp. strangulata TaxID=200361 RepID=A0A453P2V5_AEGTS
RKREQDTEETPRSRKDKGLDGSLVGARIKVWWPDDEMCFTRVLLIHLIPIPKGTRLHMMMEM